MITAAERKNAFLKDLYELVRRHDAEIHITDNGKSYGLHSGIAVVSMDSDYDNGCIKEFAEFELDTFIDSSSQLNPE